MSSVFSIKPSKYEIEHSAQIHAGIRYEAEHGVLPSDPFWSFLEHRYELNPARFSYYHPVSAWLIEHQGQHHDGHRTPHGWIGYMRHPEPPVIPPCLPSIPIGPCETPHVACPPPPPHTGNLVTPEPAASTMLAVAMLAVGGWWFLTKERTK